MRRKVHYVIQSTHLWNSIANLARMNMLLHGVKDSEFDIFHGDTLLNEWDRMAARPSRPVNKGNTESHAETRSSRRESPV